MTSATGNREKRTGRVMLRRRRGFVGAAAEVGGGATSAAGAGLVGASALSSRGAAVILAFAGTRRWEDASAIMCLFAVRRRAARLGQVGFHAGKNFEKLVAIVGGNALERFRPGRVAEAAHILEQGTRLVAEVEKPTAAVIRVLAALDQAALGEL